MKSYSVDSDIRIKVLVAMTVATFIFTLLINFALAILWAWIAHDYPDIGIMSNIVFVVGLSTSISPFLVFGILRWAFENHLWKCSLLTKVHKIPNLNGCWEGYCKSSYVGTNVDGNSYPASLTISQTFSKIKCLMKFNSSRSHNLTTGLYINGDIGVILEFSFRNQANAETIHETERDNQYFGFNYLLIDKDDLDGWYITNRNEMTRGSLRLKRTHI